MNELAVAGLAVGGLVLLTQGGAGAVVGQSAGDASVAACAYLRAHQPVAGVSFLVPTTNDPAGAYVAMRDALIGAYGQLSGVAGVYPRELSESQLWDILNTWIGAYAAGCHATAAAQHDYAIGDANLTKPVPIGPSDWTCSSTYCSQLASSRDGDVRTPIGKAVCAAAAMRDSLQSFAGADVAGSDEIVQVMGLVNALASEMSGADFTFPGVRESERDWTWSDIAGGVGAAGAATASFVGGLAGDAAGAIAGAIVGSPLCWFVGLGLAGYVVLRRHA